MTIPTPFTRVKKWNAGSYEAECYYRDNIYNAFGPTPKKALAHLAEFVARYIFEDAYSDLIGYDERHLNIEDFIAPALRGNA